MGRTMLNQSKYIKTIPFSGLFNWSVQYLSETKISFNAAYPLVRIGEFLKRNKTGIEIQDDVRYTRVTIRVRNGGVTIRDTEIGKNIGTKRQFVVSEGQFILSKIDARNGAMGIIPAELDGAIVTQDFLPYDIDTKKINPQYLVLVSTTAEFVAFCQTCSSGTTNRQRIEESKFLDIKIPLPSLTEQNALVVAYNDLIETANIQDSTATSLEQKIETYIFNKLGVKEKTSRKANKGIHFVNFKGVEKWGFEYLINSLEQNETCDYTLKNVSQLCKISSGGTPSRSKSNYYGGNIPWIKTGELNDTIINDTEEKITDIGLQNSSAKLYPAGSIVIAMYGATIGKTAKLGIEATTNQACAVLFNINNDMVDTDYLWEYMQSQTDNLKQKAYGSAQPNLNAGIISDYLIPIPPLKVQKEIVAHITGVKVQIKQLRTEATTNRTTALSDFEQKIF